MTAKEKALELINKYFRPDKNSHTYKISIMDAKDYALITINEKLNTLSGLEDSVWYFNMKSFLEEVKKEIELL